MRGSHSARTGHPSTSQKQVSGEAFASAQGQGSCEQGAGATQGSEQRSRGGEQVPVGHHEGSVPQGQAVGTGWAGTIQPGAGSAGFFSWDLGKHSPATCTALQKPITCSSPGDSVNTQQKSNQFRSQKPKFTSNNITSSSCSSSCVRGAPLVTSPGHVPAQPNPPAPMGAEQGPPALQGLELGLEGPLLPC